MRRPETICEGWFAPRRWGKSYQLEGRARHLAQMPSVASVFLLDPPRSFQDRPGFETFSDWREFQERVQTHKALPRVAVFQFNIGEKKDDIRRIWRPPFRYAIAVGNCAVVVDEVHHFAPSAAGPLIPELTQISTMGRHLPDHRGVPQRSHLIVASQRPTDVHTRIRDNLATVVVGKLRARAARNWVRDQYDQAALERMDKLRRYEWATVEPDGARVPETAPVPL